MIGTHAMQALLFTTGRKTRQIIDDGDLIGYGMSHNTIYYDGDILGTHQSIAKVKVIRVHTFNLELRL
jgi:hypothetical protein